MGSTNVWRLATLLLAPGALVQGICSGKMICYRVRQLKLRDHHFFNAAAAITCFVGSAHHITVAQCSVGVTKINLTFLTVLQF